MALPVNPVAGVAQTTILGNILVPENPTPTPAPTMTPVPTTTPAPPTPPTVTMSTANLARNAPTLTIAGSGFDATTPSANTVALSLGAFGAVTSATTTSLTVTLSTQPTSLGSLTAVVASFGGSSGTAVQVATVVAAPTVTQSLANLARNAPTLTIAGSGFDAMTPSANTVVLSLDAVGAVTSATATSSTVPVSTQPTSLGSLTAVVTSSGGSSGTAVQVATVVAATWNLAAGFLQMYTSSNSGGTWTRATSGLPSSVEWNSITLSSDGTKLAAAVYGGGINGGIYTSSNSGGTWTREISGLRGSSINWNSITSSADGTKLAVVAQGGGIYTSSNSGGTWTLETSGLPSSSNWRSITSSSDGTKLAAAVYGGGIYTSYDSGGTWTRATSGLPSGSRNWNSISSSAG